MYQVRSGFREKYLNFFNKALFVRDIVLKFLWYLRRDEKSTPCQTMCLYSQGKQPYLDLLVTDIVDSSIQCSTNSGMDAQTSPQR